LLTPRRLPACGPVQTGSSKSKNAMSFGLNQTRARQIPLRRSANASFEGKTRNKTNHGRQRGQTGSPNSLGGNSKTPCFDLSRQQGEAGSTPGGRAPTTLHHPCLGTSPRGDLTNGAPGFSRHRTRSMGGTFRSSRRTLKNFEMRGRGAGLLKSSAGEVLRASRFVGRPSAAETERHGFLALRNRGAYRPDSLEGRDSRRRGRLRPVVGVGGTRERSRSLDPRARDFGPNGRVVRGRRAGQPRPRV